MLNVHRAEIASFPQEELGNIHGLDSNRDEHGRRDITQIIVLLHGVAKNTDLPEHHSKSAVRELLDVEAEHARIELSAPEVVNDEITVGAAVLGGGKVQTLDRQEQAQTKSKDVHGRQEVAHVVINLGRIPVSTDLQCEQGNNGDQVTLESVGNVHWNMASGSDGGLEDLSGHKAHQKQFESHVRQNSLPNIWVERIRENLLSERNNAFIANQVIHTEQVSVQMLAGVPKRQAKRWANHHKKQRSQGTVAKQPSRAPRCLVLTHDGYVDGLHRRQISLCLRCRYRPKIPMDSRRFE